jgi:putative membrane protein
LPGFGGRSRRPIQRIPKAWRQVIAPRRRDVPPEGRNSDIPPTLPLRPAFAANHIGAFFMTTTFTLVAAGGLLAFVAFAGTASPVSAQPAAAQPPSTQDFVNKVAVSDMFEIQASQLALEKQPDKDTKPFARRMVKDHEKTSKELKALIDSGKVKATLPTALDSAHQKLLDDLKAKSGKDFDSSFDQAQVKGHQDAVALFEAYAKGGDNADLKKWAARTLPHLKQHLAMAEKLK